MKRYLLIGLITATVATSAWAANDSREKQMLRRMQQQVQQTEQARALAEQEKATVLADKENLERELDKAKSAGRKLSGERAARNRAEHDLKAAQAEIEVLKGKLAETETRLAEAQTQFRTTTETLVQTESVKKQTESQLADTRQNLQQCRTHNGRLYSLSREMMAKYRDKSCQDALAQAEPFTGLKKVEMENLMETWRDQADRDRLSGMLGR
jgi:chromosome segregation ATPase